MVGIPAVPPRRKGREPGLRRRAASKPWAVGVVVVLAAAFTPITALPAGANPVLVVTTTADTGPHSLREAITTANSTPGPDRIEFHIGGAAPHVIAAASSLPAITETLTIDGTSQPGFSTATHKPVVVLQGSPAGGFDALAIAGAAAGGTLIRGLEIVQWRGRAIVVDGAADVIIAGNYIGTDGTADLGNGTGFMTFLGVIQTSGECRNLLIGGRTPADRNVISGSSGAAVYIDSVGGVRVEGNYVRTNAAGTAAIEPGGSAGIYAEEDGVVIGGTARGAGNVLSGMNRGVYIFGTANISVLGNRIGTNAAGTAAVPNAFGIQLQGGVGLTIGGGESPGREPGSGEVGRRRPGETR